MRKVIEIYSAMFVLLTATALILIGISNCLVSPETVFTVIQK